MSDFPLAHLDRAAAQLAQAGQMASRLASNAIFEDYLSRRALGTVRNHFAGLILWVTYLDYLQVGEQLQQTAVNWARDTGQPLISQIEKYAEKTGTQPIFVATAHLCQRIPAAWHGVTWGLVDGFIKWQLNQGYSVPTVNNRLSIVRTYCRLATKAGVIPPEELSLIKEIQQYTPAEARRIDQKRTKNRVGNKKRESIVLTAPQARQLKSSHSDSPQGIRDRLLVCLLLDLGLRASEAAELKVEDLREPGYIKVYRQKTDSLDKMALSEDLVTVLHAYRRFRRPYGRLLRGSLKNGRLSKTGMSVRAIGARIKLLGQEILGLPELSPHDLRHTWATRAAATTNPFVLRDAGGWTNMQTPGRYVEKAKVVNKGVNLDY
ncbi:MAG: tyrosine-type recombinase/integrase [Ardenticatenaceae bacterium]|nr:tyrosine-type recombinase/integrase [Ardenticatenaceae bacterium]